MSHIQVAQSKGLVMFCWGEHNNDHDNRMILREKGIDGLIYDRYDTRHSACPVVGLHGQGGEIWYNTKQ